MKQKTYLVICPETQRLTCKRCGGNEAMPEMPIKVDYLAKRLKLFVNEHKNCKA